MNQVAYIQISVGALWKVYSDFGNAFPNVVVLNRNGA